VITVPLWLNLSPLAHLGGQPTPVPTPAPVAPTAAPPAATATEPPRGDPSIVAADAFARSMPVGWGSADIGGTYRVSGDGALNVAGAHGNVQLTSSADGSAVLDAVVVRDVVVEHSVALDANVVGELRDVSILRASSGGHYAIVVRMGPSGVLVGVERTVDGQTTVIGRFVSPTDSVSSASLAGGSLRIHAEVTGADPSTIRVRIWPAAVPEPSSWLLTTIDWAGSLQQAGAVGLGWESTTAAGGAMHFSDLTAWVTGEEAQ